MSITDMQLLVREDAGSISEGYMSVLTILKLVGKLMVMIYFTGSANPQALKTVALMPLLMFLFGCLRNTSLSKANVLPDSLGGGMLAYVGDAASNYRLIANYQQRPKINEDFAKKADALKAAALSPLLVRMNNDYFTQLLGPLFVGIYIITQAHAVLTGDLGRGTFVATLSVFSEISSDFSEGYLQMMKISSIAGCLRGMTEMLNRPTDVGDWKAVNRKRRASTFSARQKVFHEDSTDLYPTDTIPLAFENMCFAYAGGNEVLSNVDLSVAQGSIVGIWGNHGEAKNTLLKIIGMECFPTQGAVFVPTHLRILHVTQEAMLLNTSLLHNLTFGCAADETPAIMPRLTNILKRLHMDNLLDELHRAEREQSEFSDEPEETFPGCGQCCATDDDTSGQEDGAWQKGLSYASKAKIHLARALIMNPEVMVLQRPLSHFNHKEQKVVLELLNEHVKHRGLGLPPETACHRRPRTIFLSVETEKQAVVANVRWRMVRQGAESCAVEEYDPHLSAADDA